MHDFSDYDQEGQGGPGAPWFHDKHSKRKKKLEGTLGVDPTTEVEDAKSKLFYEPH